MKRTKFIAKKIKLILVISIISLSILACNLSTTVIEQPENVGGGSESLNAPENPELIQTDAVSESENLPGTGGAQVEVTNTPLPPILYYTQAGDALPAVAARFGVSPDEINSPNTIPAASLIQPGELLIIPNRIEVHGPETVILPDSEIVYSPTAVDLDIQDFVSQAGGYLSTYQEYRNNQWESGAEIIQDVALENSINPRILLAVLELQSSWVYGQPGNISQEDYPMGWINFDTKGLYKQLSWAVQQLSIGYYGWRAGSLTELTFPNQQTIRIAPSLNAGSVAIQALFAKTYNQDQWNGLLYGENNIEQIYEKMFESPWPRAQAVDPLLPENLTQPPLELPFKSGHTWSLTGGPHSAWGPDGALAALDFAPMMVEHGCVTTDEWVTASASGLVVRVGNGDVIVDLDGDGREQTGWVLLYMHISSKDRVKVGDWVNTNDPIGHPSCEGGVSTGTHVHIARKYNGEWILADGALPFNLSGWKAHAGSKIYVGYLEKDGVEVDASTVGSFESRITRP